VAILMVEQNALEALSVSARAYVLVQGRPEHEGKAADLADDPTVRDLFLGGKAQPMLGGNGDSSNKGTGDFT
jgi:ABC-type branched-subunit amino acid transport system ATPase component